MEGLTTALQGFDWSSLAKPAEAGLTGAGLIGNLINQKQRSDELNYVKSQQAALQNPTAIARDVAAATQPLDRALTESVGNVVSGSLAEQGLSQAPGIQATALSQALAPFQQQNQQTALQIVMERLGLPLQYAQAYLQGLPPNTNLSGLMYLLQQPRTPGAPRLPGNQSGFYDFATQTPPWNVANQGPLMGPGDAPPNLGDVNMPPPDFFSSPDFGGMPA